MTTTGTLSRTPWAGAADGAHEEQDALAADLMGWTGFAH